MTYTELAGKAAEKAKFTKSGAKDVLDAAFSVIADALAAGERLTIPGFGIFSVKECAERTAYNPAKNEKVICPAKKKTVFKAAKALKDAVNA